MRGKKEDEEEETDGVCHKEIVFKQSERRFISCFCFCYAQWQVESHEQTKFMLISTIFSFRVFVPFHPFCQAIHSLKTVLKFLSTVAFYFKTHMYHFRPNKMKIYTVFNVFYHLFIYSNFIHIFIAEHSLIYLSILQYFFIIRIKSRSNEFSIKILYFLEFLHPVKSFFYTRLEYLVETNISLLLFFIYEVCGCKCVFWEKNVVND